MGAPDMPSTAWRVPICPDCRQPIEWNDDAGVCIQCGGRNRRLKRPSCFGEISFWLALAGATAAAWAPWVIECIR